MNSPLSRSMADALRLLLIEHDKLDPKPLDTQGIARARSALKNYDDAVRPLGTILTRGQCASLREFLRGPLDSSGPVDDTHRELYKLGLLSFTMTAPAHWRLELTQAGRTLAGVC